MLTEAEEAVIVEFRRRTLHRCLQRHGISWLPKSEEASSNRKTFSEIEIGYVHIDSAQLRSAEGVTHTQGRARCASPSTG